MRSSNGRRRRNLWTTIWLPSCPMCPYRGLFHPVAYTPLQGVGLPILSRALEYIDNGRPFVVEDEAEPDPLFRNVVSPNPENHDTLAKVIRRAVQIDTPLALATDPDADRLAAAVWAYDNEWRILTGDEIGALLWRLDAADHPWGDRASGGQQHRVQPAGGAYRRGPGGNPCGDADRVQVDRPGGRQSRAPGRRPAMEAGVRLRRRPWASACNDAIRDKDGISAAVQFVALCRALVMEDGRTPIGAAGRADGRVRLPPHRAGQREAGRPLRLRGHGRCSGCLA